MTRSEWCNIYEFIGAAMEVHSQLGRGLLESIYQCALAEELKMLGIPFEREKPIKAYYKDIELEKRYFADFYSNGMIIELKSVSELTSEHRAQLINYLRLTKTKIGILINFGEMSLRSERYWYDEISESFILLTEKNYRLYIDD